MSNQEALSLQARKDSFWSDNDTLEENEEILDHECMDKMDYDIDQCASLSLPDMLSQQVKIEEFWNLSDSPLINQNCDGPLSKLKNVSHYLNSTTSAGVVSHMITGIHELIYLGARGDPVELEALKSFDFNTLELSAEPRAERNTSNASDDQSWFQTNVKASKTYAFMAAFKLFISKYIQTPAELDPEIFCALNRFLTSSDDEKASKTMRSNHSEQYLGLSNQCRCKIGVHSWLKGFIQQVNSRDRKAGKSKNPVYHISRLYLRFMNRNCFGKQSKQVAIILLQSFAIKWMHYMVLPFDENEEGFRDIMSKPTDMPIRKLPKFLEKVLARKLDRIVAASKGNSIQLNDSSYDSYSEVNNVEAGAIPSQTNGGKPKPNLYEDIRDTKFLSNSVPSHSESILVSQARHSPDCVNEEKTIGASTSRGSHSEMPRSNGSCERPPIRTGPISTPERRNSCRKCSAVWFWNKECDICGWRLVPEDFSDRHTQAPKMNNMFNETKISKGGHPGCFKCEKPEFVGLCHTCGFEKSLLVASVERSTMPQRPRSASSNKNNPPPDRKDPSTDTDSCPQCGASEFYGICYICNFGIWIAPSTMKRKRPTLDCNNDTAEDSNRKRITKVQDQMVFRNFMYSHQTRHRCARLGRMARRIKENGTNTRLIAQLRRRLASRWKSFAPGTAVSVPEMTFDEYLRVTGVFSDIKVPHSQKAGANPHATIENNQKIRQNNIPDAPSTKKTDNEVYVDTTQSSNLESPEEYLPSSRYSKEESPKTSRSDYLTLVKTRRGYNTQPHLKKQEIRIVDSCILTIDKPTECELPPVSLVRRGKQWLSAFPWTMAVGITSLLGFRKAQSLYDEEAAVDTELPRWLDEDVDSFRCRKLRF